MLRRRRPWLVLAAYFYAYIPMLVGIITIAAGLRSFRRASGSHTDSQTTIALTAA